MGKVVVGNLVEAHALHARRMEQLPRGAGPRIRAAIASARLDGLRDPRQRGRPGFAGCGLEWKHNAGAAALEVTEPLLPREATRSTYQPGAAVTLVGLTTASLNGATGWVAQALDGATGRIAVRLKPLSTVRVVLVKPSNLERDWDPHRDRKEY